MIARGNQTREDASEASVSLSMIRCRRRNPTDVAAAAAAAAALFSRLPTGSVWTGADTKCEGGLQGEGQKVSGVGKGIRASAFTGDEKSRAQRETCSKEGFFLLQCALGSPPDHPSLPSPLVSPL